MVFTERIKNLRTNWHLPQRKLAEVLDIDTATYCKIEHGERKASIDQVYSLAKFYRINGETLLTLWLADKGNEVVSKNENIAYNALLIAAENYK